jgi:hypothetical protein
VTVPLRLDGKVIEHHGDFNVSEPLARRAFERIGVRRQPLRSSASIGAASEYARGLHDIAGGAHEQAFHLTDKNEVELGRWLTRLPVAPDERIVLSWNPTLAVETLWPLLLSPRLAMPVVTAIATAA